MYCLEHALDLSEYKTCLICKQSIAGRCITLIIPDDYYVLEDERDFLHISCFKKEFAHFRKNIFRDTIK